MERDCLLYYAYKEDAGCYGRRGGILVTVHSNVNMSYIWEDHYLML